MRKRFARGVLYFFTPIAFSAPLNSQTAAASCEQHHMGAEHPTHLNLTLVAAWRNNGT